jgi:hypothetical protein
LNKESNLTEQDKIDLNYIVDALERNMKSMEKIEEKRKENMRDQTELLKLKDKIQQQKDQFIRRLEHLKNHSDKYILGGAVVGGAVGVIGATKYKDSILDLVRNFGNIELPQGNVLVTITITAVIGIFCGVIGSLITLATTEGVKHESKKSIGKLEELESEVEKLRVNMANVEKLLNASFGGKEKIKYSFQEIKDCLKNETQRKANSSISDNLLKDNKELIQLFTKFINLNITSK